MDMSDAEIVEGCILGNAKAQKLLYDKYSSKLFGICMRYASSEAEAYDMLQDGCIKIYGSFKSFNASGSLGGWICRIMVNTCLDTLRRNKKLRNQVQVEEVRNMEHYDASVLSQIRTDDILMHVQRLPDGYRTVFNMFAIEGYSHKEIATHLGVTENTSKSQYRKARLQLMEWITEQEEYINRETKAS